MRLAGTFDLKWTIPEIKAIRATAASHTRKTQPNIAFLTNFNHSIQLRLSRFDDAMYRNINKIRSYPAGLGAFN